MAMFKRRGQDDEAPERGDSEAFSLLLNVAALIEELAEVADRTSRSVRDEAEEQNRRLGESRRDRIAHDLALDLADRVDHLRAEAVGLKQVLKRSAGILARVEPPSPQAVAYPGTGTQRKASQDIAPDNEVNGPSQGVVLLATQMAVAGSPREEIATRLRDDFGVVDTEAVLSRALGAPPGT